MPLRGIDMGINKKFWRKKCFFLMKLCIQMLMLIFLSKNWWQLFKTHFKMIILFYIKIIHVVANQNFKSNKWIKSHVSVQKLPASNPDLNSIKSRWNSYQTKKIKSTKSTATAEGIHWDKRDINSFSNLWNSSKTDDKTWLMRLEIIIYLFIIFF